MLGLGAKWGLLIIVQWMGLEPREEAVLFPGPAVARFKRDKRVQGRQKLWVGCGE